MPVKEKEPASYKPVFVTEIDDPNLYVQDVETGTQLEKLMESMRNDIASHPPVEGSYDPPAASPASPPVDGEWYPAPEWRKSSLLPKYSQPYIDYGTGRPQASTRLGTLPLCLKHPCYQLEATEYAFAFIQVRSKRGCPPDRRSGQRGAGHPEHAVPAQRGAPERRLPRMSPLQSDSKGDVGLGL